MDMHTRKLYFGHEEDRDKGPSANSDDLEERIAARRLRISERVASLRPDYFDEKASIDEEAAVTATSNPLANAQVALSAQRIVNLCRNGNAFITNLKVACDARENLRRVEEEELDNVRQAKFDAEQKATTKLFEEVEEKWEEAKTTKGAHELHDIFEELKTNCAKIIDEKNKLIYDIHLELKAKDDHFVKELRKRTEDVDIMVERMESQMKSMQRAYDFELKEIEKAFLQDREDLLREQTTDWEDFMRELRKKQEDYLEERKNRITELEELIQKLRINHTEEFNALKLRLTTEVQNMETDLQQMKAMYQLNLEKLEYNFQVLKRRDEENTFTRSQQKRKITQLQDQLNRLRVFSKKQEESLRHENLVLSDDYKKMMEAFRDLQKKSKSLIKFEEQNFRDVWNMNEDELRKDAEKLMAADKVIMEQQLGLTWTPPEVPFMNNSGPISLAEKERRTTSIAARALQLPTYKSRSVNIRKLPKCRLPQTLKEAPKEIVGQFLTMLAFEPEFLIEVKVKKLLKDLPFDDQKLIRLDAVLNVLKVNSEELLDKLFTYFILPCDSRRPQPLTMSPPVSAAFGQDMQPDGEKSEPQECESQSTTPPESLAQTEAPTFNEEVEFSAIRLIDPIDVPQVLHRFAVENCVHATVAAFERAMENTAPVTTSSPEDVVNEAEEKDGATKATHRISARQQDLLDMEMDREHWYKYLNTFAPDEKRRMWAGLKQTLQRYLTILQARSRLIVENEALRSQNIELRHLLQLYSQSQASKSLEVEPQSTMQM
ncbi:Dynein regulatory complex protein 1 [Echinococcus granulosus]|uniref:Coiled coil domain containing protein 164 n=1 Tax=Echinococcus granulosus TaxID=6210 RepID=A0A068WU75_ECHGR|nr:Dynein regulatory complex protein 1 [Echinococcus granulosus]CDS23339.1 coiled coil domain containing protein 164 [Echinococcus granulosus]